ncbi:Hypothetical protein FKW44_002273, partial [Caligus rogercresseyi]
NYDIRCSEILCPRIKIPDARDDSGTYVFRIIRYFPSNSARLLQALNRILKLHNKLTVEA